MINLSIIIEKGFDNFSVSLSLWWRAADNRFLFGFGNINSERIDSTNTFPPGQFYHVAGTYDGTTFKLYVNGNVEGQITVTKTIAYDSSIPWTIGPYAQPA